jgi:hypothetical protein
MLLAMMMMASASAKAADVENRQEVVADFLRENFRLYKDPNGLFQMLLPKHWQVQRNVSRDDNGVVTVLFMANDPEAERVQLNGWVSAGIRIRVVLPPQGCGWTDSHGVEWSKNFLTATLQGYDRIVEAPEVAETAWGGREGAEVLVVGTTRKLSEAKLASLTLLPSREALVAIEVALPVEHKKAFAALQTIFKKSFSFGS